MKIALDSTFIYAGKFYGPGEVEVPDDVGTALRARMDALAQTARLQGVDVPQGNLQEDLAAGGSPLSPEGTDPLAAFEMLLAASYDIDRVRAASDKELLAVPGVGPATLKQIRAALA
jgi:Helix-hairpin-helix motif.